MTQGVSSVFLLVTINSELACYDILRHNENFFKIMLEGVRVCPTMIILLGRSTGLLVYRSMRAVHSVVTGEAAGGGHIVFWVRSIVFVDMIGVALVVPLLTTYFQEAGVNTEMVVHLISLLLLPTDRWRCDWVSQ